MVLKISFEKSVFRTLHTFKLNGADGRVCRKSDPIFSKNSATIKMSQQGYGIYINLQLTKKFTTLKRTGLRMSILLNCRLQNRDSGEHSFIRKHWCRVNQGQP